MAWTSGTGVEAALGLIDEAMQLLHPGASPWDEAALWLWRRRLRAEAPLPTTLPEPHARLADGDAAGAAEQWAELGMPFEQALALAEGDEEEAGLGLALLEQLGAHATAARVRADLAERGVRLGTRGPRASTRSNRFGLTKREVVVLGAIERGLTNKEIGAQLFVSAKTVDHHVSSILAKINARTRGEAAALARDHGLLE